MKTLIAYASKHGTTRKAADRLAEELAGEVVILNVDEKAAAKTRVEDFDRVIVGGSIYIGKIQKSVRKFLENNLDKLLQVDKLGLFVCCGEEEKYFEQMINIFPEELMDKAEVKGFFGYEYDLDKLGFLSRVMLKKVAGIEESEAKINYDNIIEFAEKL